MDSEELKELYQSLVLDHSKHPKNFGSLTCSCETKGKNPSCGDEVNLYVKYENNCISDIKFNGDGCALCIASASLMTQSIKNKDLKYSEKLLNDFISFITKEQPLDEDYEPLHIFEGVKNFPLRVKCVLLAWRALEKNLAERHNYGN